MKLQILGPIHCHFVENSRALSQPVVRKPDGNYKQILKAQFQINFKPSKYKSSSMIFTKRKSQSVKEMILTLKKPLLAFSRIVQKKYALSIIEGSTVCVQNYHSLASFMAIDALKFPKFDDL